MAAKTKSMHQIKQVIELFQKGKGIRETERLTGISRKTIRNYLHRIKSLDIPPEALLAMEDESLSIHSSFSKIVKEAAEGFFDASPNDLSVRIHSHLSLPFS